jgi:hypothetical protein
MAIKNYIAKHTYERSDLPIPAILPQPYLSNHRQGPINVAYNRAPDGLCATRKPLQDGP